MFHQANLNQQQQKKHLILQLRNQNQNQTRFQSQSQRHQKRQLMLRLISPNQKNLKKMLMNLQLKSLSPSLNQRQRNRLLKRNLRNQMAATKLNQANPRVRRTGLANSVAIALMIEVQNQSLTLLKNRFLCPILSTFPRNMM